MWGFPENRHKKRTFLSKSSLVGDGGFEPPKALPADLQSVPFGHSGNPPNLLCCADQTDGAGRRTRTPDLLITNQLLYQLSYTSTFVSSNIIPNRLWFVNNKNGGRIKYIQPNKTNPGGVIHKIFLSLHQGMRYNINKNITPSVRMVK